MRPEERIAEIEDFVRYAQLEWPAQRERADGRIARRCARCIVSERYAPLRGALCPMCASSSPGPETRTDDAGLQAMRQELDRLLRDHEGSGSGRYDALVMFSGGKDSTLLVHRLKTEYPGLRMLAFMVDNGFASSVALANVRRVFARLDVDHMVFKPKASLYAKTFRHALTHLNEGGCYTTVDRVDGDLTFDIGRNMAAGLGIPLLVSGLSQEQCEKILGMHSFQSTSEEERRQRISCAGFVLSDIYTPEERRYWWDGTAWPVERVPRFVCPFYAWRLPEPLIRSEVVRLGLIPEGYDNPLVTNNDLIPVMLALDIVRLGYSGFEPEFAQMVREGKADREPWLNVFQAAEWLTLTGGFLPRCIDETLGRLGLSRRELRIPDGSAV